MDFTIFFGVMSGKGNMFFYFKRQNNYSDYGNY